MRPRILRQWRNIWVCVNGPEDILRQRYPLDLNQKGPVKSTKQRVPRRTDPKVQFHDQSRHIIHPPSPRLSRLRRTNPKQTTFRSHVHANPSGIALPVCDARCERLGGYPCRLLRACHGLSFIVRLRAERVKTVVRLINGLAGRVFTSNARSLRSLRMAKSAGSVHPLVVARNR